MNVLSDQGRAELVKIHKLYTKLGNCEKESLIRLTLQQLKEHFITALDVYRSIIDLNSGKRLSPQMVFWLQFMRLVLPKLHRIALEIQTRQAHQARQAAVNPIVLWNCIWMTCEQLKKVRSVAKKSGSGKEASVVKLQSCLRRLRAQNLLKEARDPQYLEKHSAKLSESHREYFGFVGGAMTTLTRPGKKSDADYRDQLFCNLQRACDVVDVQIDHMMSQTTGRYSGEILFFMKHRDFVQNFCKMYLQKQEQAFLQQQRKEQETQKKLASQQQQEEYIAAVRTRDRLKAEEELAKHAEQQRLLKQREIAEKEALRKQEAEKAMAAKVLAATQKAASTKQKEEQRKAAVLANIEKKNEKKKEEKAEKAAAGSGKK